MGKMLITSPRKNNTYLQKKLPLRKLDQMLHMMYPVLFTTILTDFSIKMKCATYLLCVLNVLKSTQQLNLHEHHHKVLSTNLSRLLSFVDSGEMVVYSKGHSMARQSMRMLSLRH